MKGRVIIFILLLVNQLLQAQSAFRTIVPQKPVMSGESFRVQYVVEGGENSTNFIPPEFQGFRLVSGPEIYFGRTGPTSIPGSVKNIVYTLQAIEPGRYFIQGATALINGKKQRSNDVLIEVMSRESSLGKNQLPDGDEENPSYLKPGEDPYEKIRQNLFIKVKLDRKVCYAGEPVVATFKLYSRLQSKSDIIKNPGFYGFAVQDIINLDDKIVSTQLVNGRLFDVHTVRKVQLYPLSAGEYIIDAMEIKNKVEFSRSMVGNKAEQEIIEGIFEEKNESDLVPGGEIYENNMRTEVVKVRVKELPVKNKPRDFNGATGSFSLTVSFEKDELAKNEEGHLLVRVNGKGNFNQLIAPVIQWPNEVEGFEPEVIDNFDKTFVPLKGSRTFRYAFVGSKPGVYHVNVPDLPFFDPDSNRYRITGKKEGKFVINEREKEKPPVTASANSVRDLNRRSSRIAAGIVAAIVLLTIFYWFLPRRKSQSALKQAENSASVSVSVDELMKPAFMMIPAADKDFYTILYQVAWKWLALRYGLAGTQLSKQAVVNFAKEAGKEPGLVKELLSLLQICETGMFTNANLGIDKGELISRMKYLLTELGR